MSVVLTDKGFKFHPIMATNPLTPDNKFRPNKIMHEWMFSAQGAGDGSAGNVSVDLDFGSSFDKNHYIVITCIFAGVPGTQTMTLKTNSDCWDNLYFPGHANEEICFFCSYSAGGIYGKDQLKKLLYLGRPRQQDANPGVLTWAFDTNTNLAAYNLFIQGFTLERPMPFTSILQP